jgi:hypothetical protein
MEVFLGKVTQQAMNYAIRSGLSVSATMLIRHGSKLIANAPKSTARDELDAVQHRLAQKIQIITPAIDMIDLIAARGHTSLESAIVLTKEIRYEMETLGRRLADAHHVDQNSIRKGQSKAVDDAHRELELKGLLVDIKKFLTRIEDALPLLSLAITTSGVSLSTTLPHTVSPSRLLQASTFLTAGDTQYTLAPHTAVQIGPTFTLTVYMLFAGHNRPQSEEEIRETTWKEVMHKARVKLRRVPLDLVMETGTGSKAMPTSKISSASKQVRSEERIFADVRSDEFAYQLMIIEDLEDDRVHDFEEDQAQPGPFDDIDLAGVREMVPIHQISKIFYADTSKVLNIGADSESNHPVLLLKRDLNAYPPRKMMEQATRDESILAAAADGAVEDSRSQPSPTEEDPWRLPPSLDPEWIAFEVYTSEDDDSSSLGDGEITDKSRNGVHSTRLEEDIEHLHLSSPSPSISQPNNTSLPLSTSQTSHLSTKTSSQPWSTQIRTSLSLLELLLRLTSLQQFQQQSHLSITDELLNFFLEESASTGAGGDENYRQALRSEARRRVGWDPYDESPMKRRGEEYQYAGAGGEGGWGGSAPGTPGGQGYYGGAGVESPGPFVRQGSGYSGGGGSERGSARPTPDRGRSYNDGWMPSSVGSSGSGKGREAWLRRDSGRGKNVSSPLRPTTGRSDEGLGTSPASALAGVGGVKSP